MAIAPKVSVVVVNFNGGELLLRSLRSVLASSLPIELFVCDNGSTDGSFVYARSALPRDERISFIDNHSNLGFSAANNIAIKQARGEYLLLLNPDCVVEQDTLSRMVEALDTHPEAGMVGCRVLNPDGTEQRGCRRSLPTTGSGFQRAFRLEWLLRSNGGSGTVDLNETPLPDAPAHVEAISGAFMLVRRQALEEVGLLDEGYFLHCEDLDWCYRFSDKGWKILFVPEVTVVHHKGACSLDRPVRVEWHKHRGMMRYYRKFLQRQSPWLFSQLVMAGILSRFLAIALRRSLFRPKQPPGDLSEKDARVDSPVSANQQWPTIPQWRRVLVTGGTGFIGRRLVSVLIAQGVRVRVLSRNPEQFAGLWQGASVELVPGDLAKGEGLAEACRDVDMVFHLASYAPSPGVLDAESGIGHHRVTVEGTKNLLSAISGGGIGQLLFVSSVRAFDHLGSVVTGSEAEAGGAYGVAKRAAEQLVLQAGRQYGLAVSVLRLPAVYGSVEHGNVAKMLAAIDRGRFPPLPETGNRRSMVHLDDVVRALLLVAGRREGLPDPLTVTDGRLYSGREVYELIAKALGKSVPGWSIPLWSLALVAWIGNRMEGLLQRPMPINGDRLQKLLGSAWYDSSRLEQEFGFRPRYTLESALPEMVAGFRNRDLPSGQGVTRAQT